MKQSNPFSFFLALKFSLIYIVISCLYIFFSDRFVSMVFTDISTITMVNTYKGWGFVIITGVIIYILILKASNKIQEKENKYQQFFAFSENRYSSIYNSAPVMLHSIDREGRLISVSEFWLEKMGYKRSEVIGRFSTEFLTAESSEYAKKIVLPNFMAKGICKDISYQFVKKNGEIIDVLLSAISEKDKNGNVNRSLAVITDITQLKQKDDALRDREEFLRKMIQTIPDVVLQTDLEGRIVYINDIGLKLSGFSSFDNLKGRNMMSFVAPEDYERAISNTKLMFEKSLGPIEYNLILNEFVKVSCEINGEVLRHTDGSPYGMVNLIRDITPRKIIEKSLKESEEKFRSIVETSPITVFEIDNQSTVLYISPRSFDVVGYTPEEMIGQSIYTFIAPTYHKIVEESLKNHILENKEFNQLDIVLVNKNGSLHTIDIRTKLILNNEGVPIKIRGTALDITEKKRIEEALWLNEQKHRVLLDDASDPIFSFERDGTYLYVNKAFSTPFNKKPEEIIGKKIWDIFSNDEAEKRFAAVKKAFETGVIIDLDVKVPTSTGDTFYQTTVKPIINDDGEVKTVICISKNITERRKAESELKKLVDTKDKFFSIIAHDLKNPFNSIIGFSDLLKIRLLKDKNEKASQLANILNSSAKEAYNLLENLLVWANSQRGDIHFNPMELGLIDIIENEISLVNSMALSKGVAIKYHIAEKLTVKADEHMLKVIIRNLITNAIKYSNQGGEIIVSTFRKSDFIEISVIDNGVGMSEDIRAKLFKLNPEISKLGTEGERGTGLGLILCKEFIEKHGGQIWVESKLGEGTKFSFTIPYISVN